MKAFSITDVGRKRQMNQDYIYSSENAVGSLPNLFIVADGMGGHKAGDFASRCCVETVVETIKNSKLKTPIGILDEAIQNANEKIIEQSESNSELEGMGTTIVAVTVIDSDAYIANIGDSRLYLIDEDIKQITEDHSLVEAMVRTGEIDKEEARVHPNKNIITRAVGTNHLVSADYFEVCVKPEDILLLCSDGLSNMLEDEEIFSIVKKYSSILEETGNHLVEQANEHGGKDNIGIVLVKI